MYAVTCVRGTTADVALAVALTQELADQLAFYSAGVARLSALPGFVSAAFFGVVVEGFNGECRCVPGATRTGRECFACQCDSEGFGTTFEVDGWLAPLNVQGVVLHLKPNGSGYFTFYEKHGLERFETPTVNLLELLADAGVQPTKENT